MTTEWQWLSLLSVSSRSFRINNPEVVSKSYPNYWKDLEVLDSKLASFSPKL